MNYGLEVFGLKCCRLFLKYYATSYMEVVMSTKFYPENRSVFEPVTFRFLKWSHPLCLVCKRHYVTSACDMTIQLTALYTIQQDGVNVHFIPCDMAL